MTTVITSERFEHHLTGNHPESPQRIAALRKMLATRPDRDALQFLDPLTAEIPWLTAVHPAHHVHHIEQSSAAGGGRLDPDTVTSVESFDVAKLAAGAACAAVQSVVAGVTKNALCLIRPPGHHALINHAMGFCLFNNVAIAAKYAQQHLDLDRILIIDWDVHHGNGTQLIFDADETVTFCSIHRHPFYPGTGTASETGTGAGLGYTFNAPIAFGTSRQEYFSRFEKLVETAAEVSRPDLVLLSAGFDAHRLDPVGSLGLETEDFARLTEIVVDLAHTHCQGRLVSLLEGGYHLAALADSVSVHLDRLLAAHASDCILARDRRRR